MNLYDRFFNGEIQLWKTYWIGLVAVNVITQLIIKILSNANADFMLILIMSISLLLWSAAALIATWRSAKKYTGSIYFKSLAQIAVVFGWISLFANCSAVLVYFKNQ